MHHIDLIGVDRGNWRTDFDQALTQPSVEVAITAVVLAANFLEHYWARYPSIRRDFDGI